MKNILFIDTSTNLCKIGIYYNKKIFEYNKLTYKDNLKYILSIIDKLLKKNNIKLNNINIISCINEPGENSTGIKIGLSISKGLSIGLNNIPIIQISLFEIILEIVYKKIKIKNNFLSLIEAYSDSLYLSICKKKKNKYIIYDKKILKINDIINYINNLQGYWICNIFNFEKNFDKYFIENNYIKYTNFNSYKFKNIIKIILNKFF